MNKPDEYNRGDSKDTHTNKKNFGNNQDLQDNIELDTRSKYVATNVQNRGTSSYNQVSDSGGDIWEKYTNIALGNFVGQTSDSYKHPQWSETGDSRNQIQQHNKGNEFTNIAIEQQSSTHQTQNTVPPHRALFDNPEPNACFWLVLILFLAFITFLITQLITR